ncbi:MAG: coproporphyrinogen-III oxidase family protein, partial [Thermoanaerobaculia bacterium]
FFGGGSPSILEPEEISSILSKFNKKKEYEITIECNPEDIDEKKTSAYLEKGINRFSLGVQSLNEFELKTLKRRHSKEKALKVLKILKEKTENFNCDLIVGIKGQSKKTLKDTLEEITSYSTPHLSLYPLEMKKNKNLMEKDEKKAELLEFAWNFLKKKGYIHYEISNFAKEGFQCRHNLGYWKGKKYMGFGPSAHSFLKNFRFKNTENLEIYIKNLMKGKLSFHKLENLSKNDMEWEKFILSLRTCEGWKFNKSKKEKLSEFIKEGFLEKSGDFIKITEKGMLVYNQIIIKLSEIFF